jgi:dinuclear metal center YbgI/SA1388 family protein
MEIDRFIELMETIAPPELADSYDQGRIGLVIEGTGGVNRVCSALDATPAVIERAVRTGADTLVVHHTPLWDPTTTVRGFRASLLRPILTAGLHVYVMHSNFDHAEGGVNDVLGDLLGLTSIDRMSLGIVGDCALTLPAIASRLGGGLRVYGAVDMPCRLAVVGGSGFDPDLLDEAVSLGADAFLSAELKHSTRLAGPLPLIESTHYALEAPAMRTLAERMGWEFLEDPPHVVMIE